VVLAENFPGAITEAVEAMPLSAVSKLEKSLAMAKKRRIWRHILMRLMKCWQPSAAWNGRINVRYFRRSRAVCCARGTRASCALLVA